MRKSQIEAMALNAMRDAMAAGKSEADIIIAGTVRMWRESESETIVENLPAARALYDKHFEVREPN